MEALIALSLETVSRLTGLSPARLRRWDSSGFFVPGFASPDGRRPRRRVYSLQDLIALHTIVRLMENGVSHRRLRDVVPLIRSVPIDDWRQRQLHVKHGEVMLDGQQIPCASKIYENRTDSDLVSIDMKSLVEEVQQQVQRLSERTPAQIGRVIRDRSIMNGEPILAGTRIPTATVFDYARHGETPAQIVASYPRLTEEDVAAAVAFERERRRRGGDLEATG
jgi:uncharacterized protein (DUF433 family)